MSGITHKELTQDDVDMYFFYRMHGLHKGFFQRYFIHLPKSRTTVEAFRVVNEEYFTLFSEYKYSCVESFYKSLKKYLSNEVN